MAGSVAVLGIVLCANILGTVIIARLVSLDGLLPAAARAALNEIGRDAVTGSFWPTLIKAIFAGWLIALMIWLLPSARSARLLVIMLLTYVVAIGRFSHVIAGSVEAFFAVFVGEASFFDYLTGFFAPTIIGNTLGGVALVALLNHALSRPSSSNEETPRVTAARSGGTPADRLRRRRRSISTNNLDRRHCGQYIWLVRWR